MGPWREVDPRVETYLHPNSFAATSVSIISALQKQSIAFKTYQGELNLKTSPFSGFGSVFCSLSTWKLWGCRGGVFRMQNVCLRRQIEGEKVEAVTDLIFLGSKITARFHLTSIKPMCISLQKRFNKSWVSGK